MLVELNNASLDTQESRRQQQRKDVLEMLRRFYPESVVRENDEVIRKNNTVVIKNNIC